MTTKSCLFLAVTIFTFGCCESDPREKQAKIFRKEQSTVIAILLERLTQADRMDLVLLDGGQIIKSTSTKDDVRFHGWKIRQSARRIEIGEQDEIIELLQRELPERRSSHGSCFEPVYALEIRLKDGKSIDLVFCFHCGGMLFFDETGSEQEPWLPDIDELRPILETIAKSLEVPS